ncbi:MAG: DUF6090 family protein [Gelidibacter sp.]
MIKLFKNIRKSLLVEGKTTNYLKYAIGEIILVVIGILIALQVNNWNENRKQREQEKIYLQNLSDDLNTQIQVLDNAINFESIIIKDTKDILQHYDRNNGFKNLDSIYPKMNDMVVRWTFVNANTTLLELVNSGQINIIYNKSLKQKLMAFNETMQRFVNTTINNNSNIVDNYIVPNVITNGNYAWAGYSEAMYAHFQTLFPMDRLQLSGQNLSATVTQILNDPKLSLKMINSVSLRNGLAILQKSGYQALKDKALKIKKLIDTELNP